MENVQIKDALKVVLKDSKGNIKKQVCLEDLIVDVGWDFICDTMAKYASQPSPMEYLAIGTGGTTATAGDTTLESEITTGGGERVQATYSHTPGTKIFMLSKTFTFTSSFSVNEAGIFNANSDGIMLCRRIFDMTFEAVTTDVLSVEFTFTFS